MLTPEMMKSKEEIRSLLDKYLEGLSSLEEEKALHRYFQSGMVDKEFLPEAHWFLNISREHSEDSDIDSLEVQMMDWVDQQEKKGKSVRLKLWISGIAAGIVLLLGTSALFYHFRQEKVQDTYQDPKIAYLEAKKILMYVSQTLNKGTEKLQTVSRIDAGSNELSIFSTFSSGLKNLELMDKYQEKTIK